jgi:hypothetical protein
VSDGGQGDDDGKNNGVIKISQVLEGKYVIKQVGIPVGFFSLLGEIVVHIHPSQLDQIVQFQVVAASTKPDQLPLTPITPPSLDDNTIGNWTSFSAKAVHNGNSNVTNNINQGPGIILAGTANSTAINAAINSTTSISLKTSFATLTNGAAVINTIGLKNYTLPNSTSIVPIIPTIVTAVNQTSGQVVATPPLTKAISGQEMITPVADSLIPSFGGLKQLDVQSAPTAKPTGKTPNEWFVAEVDNKIPSSITSGGIDGTPILFLSIQYPFEQTGVGFNWGDPQNHAKPPTITIVVNKVESDFIQNDNAGCPMINAYTLTSGSWTSNGLGEISSSSISPTQCQVKIQSQHLSKFAFSLKHLDTIKNIDTGQFAIGTVIGQIPGVGIAEAAKGNMTNSTKAEPVLGFSNVHCSKGTEYAFMTGQYTSGSLSYKAIFIKMILLDRVGNILATGNGFITAVNAHETTNFDAIARYDGSFASCQVQVDSSIEK